MTVVQQIDTEGPVAVERISNEFADLACTADNARNLVDALHSGRSVTLTSNVNGQTKTATFNPPATTLGYGDAYIALALAAEALKSAGVTGCATPDQWNAVLVGGPLAAAGTSSTSTSTSATASSSSKFPGVLTLRSQGQGWGQIAETTHVQLGQVLSRAQSLKSTGAGMPTGRSSEEMNPSSRNPSGPNATGEHDRGKHKGKAKGHDNIRERDQERKDQGSTSSSSTVTPPSSSPDR